MSGRLQGGDECSAIGESPVSGVGTAEFRRLESMPAPAGAHGATATPAMPCRETAKRLSHTTAIRSQRVIRKIRTSFKSKSSRPKAQAAGG
jgi:hypothetical protein